MKNDRPFAWKGQGRSVKTSIFSLVVILPVLTAPAGARDVLQTCSPNAADALSCTMWTDA